MSNNIEVVLNSLENLLTQLYYERVEWNDGADPAINAENLNKSETALELLFGTKNINGYLHQIINAFTNNDSTLLEYVNSIDENKANKEHSHTLSNITDFTGYATEKWVEDKNYLTQHQSLDNYYTKDQTNSAIEEAKVDLTPYAKAADIPKNVSQLNNDANYLTEVPSEYITETELASKGYLTEHQSLNGYAKLTDIPDVSNFITEVPAEYVTETELNNKGYATEKYVSEILDGIDVPDSLINSGDTVILKCGSATELIKES